MLNQRDYVLPDDVQRMAPLVLSHRVVLARHPTATASLTRDLIVELIQQVTVPV